MTVQVTWLASTGHAWIATDVSDGKVTLTVAGRSVQMDPEEATKLSIDLAHAVETLVTKQGA